MAMHYTNTMVATEKSHPALTPGKIYMVAIYSSTYYFINDNGDSDAVDCYGGYLKHK